MPAFQLDEEQRARVRDCVEKDHIKLDEAALERFLSALEASIANYQSMLPQPSDRQVQGALRTLWLRASRDRPPVRSIRHQIERLPAAVLNVLDDRATHIVPRLEAWRALCASVRYRQEPLARDVPKRRLPLWPSPFRPKRREGWVVEGTAASLTLPMDPTSGADWASAGASPGFRAWARTAPDDLFIQAVEILAADGAQRVPGRSRGGGKRSRARLEPRILGVVRGAQGAKPKGAGPRPRRVSSWSFALRSTGRSAQARCRWPVAATRKVSAISPTASSNGSI